MDHETFRSAYSFKPQAVVTAIINRAAIFIEFFVPWLTPVLQNHDELVLECDIPLVPQALPFLHTVLEIPIHIDGIDQPLIIPAEIKVGPNWYDMKEEQKYMKELQGGQSANTLPPGISGTL